MVRAETEGAEVEDAVAGDHVQAGKSLLETPATHLGPVGISIWTADNLPGLAMSYLARQGCS